MPAPSRKRAAALLKAMRGRRILVLGDVMLDEFIWGRVARISPEAPVPVVQVTDESFHLGGAGNVAANLRSLGGAPVLTGVVGRDEAGGRIGEALEEAGITSRLEVSRSGRPTTVKTRVIAHNQQVVRADREQAGDISAAVERRIVEGLREELRDCEALVISDYQKGAVTASLLRKALPLARRRRVPILVDPSHGTGKASLVPSMARASCAAGADGVMLEVHIKPEAALSDAPQALLPATFRDLCEDLRLLSQVIHRQADV